MTEEFARNVSDGDKEVALANEIIRVTVGSGAHGMAIEGRDDNDEMGVYIQTKEQILGLEPSANHYTSRTKPAGVRSEPGDTDLIIYSLRKYMRLAIQGNPSVLILLYSKGSNILTNTMFGKELQSLAPSIISKDVGHRFLGYLDGQKKKLLGLEKQGRMPSRPELIEQFGYDTKFASHAVRLGLQGIQMVTTGTLTFPMKPIDVEMCMQIKRGEVDYKSAMACIDWTRSRLFDCMEKENVLPDAPNMAIINDWMCHTHIAHWTGWRRIRT